VTVSVGGAAFPPDARNAEELLTAADDALYRAKRLGRNRLELGSGTVRERVAMLPRQAGRRTRRSLQIA
jgi:predicted signal transduction protein with EAL and GGDEF domain